MQLCGWYQNVPDGVDIRISTSVRTCRITPSPEAQDSYPPLPCSFISPGALGDDCLIMLGVLAAVA